jgi:bifunctional non-homologous end joining protein LigD
LKILVDMKSRFVIHEHHATHLHFDFRLEMEGVLRSWAVPKGPSLNPTEKRLAILVEDHPLEYIDFEGIIPRGMAGAGPVLVWDAGTFELLEKKEDRIVFNVKGKILQGEFALVRLKGRGRGNEWLLIKKKDAFASESWKLEPRLTPARKAGLKERVPPCEAS